MERDASSSRGDGTSPVRGFAERPHQGEPKYGNGLPVSIDAIGQRDIERGLRRPDTPARRVQLRDYAARTTIARRSAGQFGQYLVGLPKSPPAQPTSPIGTITLTPPDSDADARPTHEEATLAYRTLRARQLPRGVPRAAWTPRERRFDTADRTARAAALRLLPIAQASSPTVSGVEAFGGIL